MSQPLKRTEREAVKCALEIVQERRIAGQGGSQADMDMLALLLGQALNEPIGRNVP